MLKIDIVILLSEMYIYEIGCHISHVISMYVLSSFDCDFRYIAYILLGGYPPFIENNQRELFRKIRRGKYEVSHIVFVYRAGQRRLARNLLEGVDHFRTVLGVLELT